MATTRTTRSRRETTPQTAEQDSGSAESSAAPEGTETPESTAGDTQDATVTETPDSAPDATQDSSDGTQNGPEDESGTESGPDPEWTDVLPLVALMAGNAPSPVEVNAAPLVWAILNLDTPTDGGGAVGVTAAGIVGRAEEADLPEIETTTVKAILARWARVGLVRCEDDAKGRQRWTPGTPAGVLAAVTTPTARPAGSRTSALAMTGEPRRTTAPTVTPKEQWFAPGTLRASVEEAMREDPDATYSAGELGKAIGANSNGSVRAALDAMCNEGVAECVADTRPMRWQLIG